MNNLIVFALIVLCALIPFGFGVVYLLYKKTIVFPVALMVFISSMFCSIVAFAVSEYGFVSLYWAIPLCLVFLVSTNFVFKKTIQKPILKLNENLNSLSLGVLDFEVDKNNMVIKNELGDLAKAIHVTLNGLHNTSMFANEIANKNFDVNYQLLSNDDEIGKALLRMKDSLATAANNEKQRKEEEQKSLYITNGIAKFGDILRVESESLHELSNRLLSELVTYTGANQGGLFVLNDEADSEIFEMVGAVAYERNKLINKNYGIGEGLIGRCAFEKKSIFLTDVPENYMNITSGLGTANPRCLLIEPALVDDKVFAVLELASFSVFEGHIIQFIEKLSENIASVISTVRNNERVLGLLETSKQNNEEMAAQEEELRQNIEELTATQEEMRRKEAQLKSISAKLEEQEKIIKEQIEQLKSEE